MSPELKYWMWLTMAFGPANARKWNTMSHYVSAKEAYERISSGELRYVSGQDRTKVESAKLEDAEKVIEYCRKNGINIYCYDCEGFPDRLREIYNPPSVLFVLGRLEGMCDSVMISCVGTRRPSKYSVSVTEKIIGELVDAGVVIASGFAVGLDSVALRSAMLAGGRAIAVLPCGLMYNYPKENSSAKKIIAAKGAVISEYFPNDRVSPLTFRARNRILAGISLGTFVTQAGAGSGALSTASFAIAQGKDLFCIPPHELFNDNYSGVTGLLRDGAIPVFDARDILNEYYSVYAHKLNSGADALRRGGGLFESAERPRKQSEPEETKKRTKKSVSADNSAAYNAMDLESLPEGKRLLVEYIYEHGSALFDELSEAAESGGICDIETLLTELECDGYITSLPGNRYAAAN